MLHRNQIGFLLESSLRAHGLGRYSFFGVDPFMVFESKNASVFITREGKREQLKTSAFLNLRQLLDTHQLAMRRTKIDMPFLGGAVGFLSYDLGLSLEKIIRSKSSDISIPDMWFGFFDVVVCVDHYKDRMLIFSSGFPETKERLRRIRADVRLKEFMRQLQKGQQQHKIFLDAGRHFDTQAPTSNFSACAYCSAVVRVRDYIARGDIYQLNLSQRFHANTNISDEALYARLRNVFPVPFGGMIKTGFESIVSGSPERFLRYDGRVLRTRPMKGTRPRALDGERDRQLRKELLQSHKDKAELLMIVDLERNDLGRVCDYGSVRVEKLRCLEEYSSVFQTTAEVSGRLHMRKDRIDALKACFPGGSITGCPKIRAMHIIEELEPHARGIYTGCLGYLSFSGQMDFNILIRSFLKKKHDVYFGVGGGIVYDSTPHDEYQETLVKAQALLQALCLKQPPKDKKTRIATQYH